MTFLRSKLTRTGGVLAATAASALILAGCSSSPSTSSSDTSSSSSSGTSSSSTASANYNIAYLPKSLGNMYFQASDSGGKTAVGEFGGTYSEVGPTATGANVQVPFIQTLTQQQVGAIVTAADDPQAACTALNAAMQAGIKVVTFDSDTNCRNLFINQATPDGIAQSLVDIMGKALSGTGKVGIESGGPNATNLNEWVKDIKADMAKSYPKIQIVDTVYGNDADQDSLNAAKGLVQAHPDLNGIIAPDSVAVKNAALYLSGSQYKGKIVLTGLGLPSELKQYVHDGTIKQFALWDPTNLGYLAAYAAKALIDGTITGTQGDKFTAGKLGSYTVGADQTVILGPPTVFDVSNVDNYNF